MQFSDPEVMETALKAMLSAVVLPGNTRASFLHNALKLLARLMLIHHESGDKKVLEDVRDPFV